MSPDTPKISLFLFRDSERVSIRERSRRILSGFLGIPLDDGDFLRNPQGKPFLKDRSLKFNLSHSGEYALLAVSKREDVGVDLQKKRDDADAERLARRFFSARERDWVGSDLEKFYVLWTRKEAALKALGEGLRIGLDRVDVLEDVFSHEGRKGRLVSVDLNLQGYQAAVGFMIRDSSSSDLVTVEIAHLP